MSRGIATGFVILLVEDNPGDVRLTREALKDKKIIHGLHVARNGIEAIAFLRREEKFRNAPRPDLIILDLDLPEKNGQEVLAEIKSDLTLKEIPVVVLTSSEAEQDIMGAYRLQANCYVTKPFELEHFFHVVRSIGDFWLSVADLPRGG